MLKKGEFKNKFIFLVTVIKIVINFKINKMKKIVSSLAIVAFLFSVNVNAQEQPRQKKRVKATTEKAAVTTTVLPEEKKECATSGAKKACCAAKKEESKS